MDTIVISDLHLTDKFVEQQFIYLKNLFQQYHRIIINGDFWDGYIISVEEFVKSKWKKLFPILKKKDTVYIYGNHDHKQICKGYEKLFSNFQANSVDLVIYGQNFHIEHGDRLLNSKFTELEMVRLLPVTVRRLNRFLFEDLFIKIFKKKYKLIHRNKNIFQFNLYKDRLSEDQILICGHTHLAADLLHTRYMNSGFIGYGYCQYISIKKSKIELIDTCY
jgi:UDP-2,3-diacylglucosamine pyrophosphatase LpxH